MAGPQIEYNREHSGIENALRAVDRPGDYFVSGSIEGVMPKMSVERVGRIAFPILESQARALASAAERAPYGRGPDTVFDPDVRDCWQIDANRVGLFGAGWEKTFRSILESVADGLGCQRDALMAQLYKLLIYEEGGFFAEHRDTEKVDGMIATLVVALPTAGQGGDLVIRHLDREATVSLQVDEPGGLKYAAFYADCVHRTQPVESGHRVSLVYNVVMKPGAGPTLLAPPDYAEQIGEVSGILSEWVETRRGPRKIVWLLEHEYSELGLGQAALKGLDEAVGRTLRQAAERSGCVLHSAILSIEESCLPDYDDVDEYGGEIDYTGRECAIEEVFEVSRTLATWAEPDLTGSELPAIPLLDEEPLPVGCLDDAEPDEQTLFEASGNEGVSLERSYRLAAFVLWPRSREVSVIADGSMKAAIEYAERMLTAGPADRGAPVTGSELAAQLIECWPEHGPAMYSFQSRTQIDPSFESLLALLSKVSDEEQSARFVCGVVAKQYHAAMNDALAPFLGQAKPATLARFFPALMEASAPRSPNGVLALVAGVRMSQSRRAETASEEACRIAIRAALQVLPEAFVPSLAKGEPEWKRPEPQALSADGIRDLLAECHRLGLHSEAESAAALFARHPDQVDPYRTIPDALKKLGETARGFTKSKAYALLWHLSCRRLLERSAVPPEAPTDERIEPPTRCSCEHCKELRAFCLDPEAKTKRFRAAQHIRGKVERCISMENLDIDCRTEASGRPYTLVCEKVPRSYLRRFNLHAADIDSMQTLSRAAPTNDSKERAQALAQLHEAMAR